MSVTGTIVAAAESGSEGFHAPGPASFDLPAIFHVGGLGVTKPMVLLLLSVVVISWFMIAASRKAAVVPSRLQFAGDSPAVPSPRLTLRPKHGLPMRVSRR